MNATLLALRFFVVILVIGAARASSAASVDGIPLHWTSSGSGPQTLVLVHGWTCDDSSWSAQVPALMGSAPPATPPSSGTGVVVCIMG